MNEIAQDASTVGNALKTISMRIRAMDEETGEFDDTLQTISGDIYELTHGQVSIMQDANTYKDIYTILDDISKVWDSLTDKEHATLTETLFGKHRANIGSAIISNFEQARKAIETMENADGGAMAEMEVIMDSISYRANIFKETLVGIAQNSFSQDFMKSMVDSGTRILNVFDDLSPSISFILEQFATLLEFVTKLADTIGGIPILIAGIGLKSIGNIKTWLYELKEVQMAINGISALSTSFNGGTNMFADTAVVTQYANQLRGLSAQQVELALSTKLLTAEQKQQIMAELGLIASENKIQSELLQTTLAQAGLSAEKQKAILLELKLINATTLEPIARKSCTKAQLEEQLALHGVTGAQAEQIMSTLGMSTANATATVSFKLLSKSILSSAKAMGVWLTTTPAGWATIAVTAISAVVLGINAYNKKQEEAIQNAKDMADNTSSQISEMDKLVSEYEAIIDSEKTEAEKTEELNEWKRELVKTYDLEKEKLEEINLEREKGIELLKNEIDESKKNKYNKYLDEYQEQIEDANEKFGQEYTLQIHLGSQLSTDDNISCQEYWYGVEEKLQEMFDDITPQESQFFMGMENIATISFDDSIDQLNELTKIYEYLLDLQSKRQFNGYDLTEDEKLIFDAVKQKIDEVNDKNKNGELDIYKEAAKAQAYVDFLNYVAVNSAENVGKDTFKAWTEGLLNQAENAEQKRNLEELIANQFPDLTKYFNNLDKAYGMFGIDDVINDANEGMKKAFINGLSDEDLEIATQIPDLFADGLEGATKKIEAWKKQNSIEAEVKITIDEALEGQTNKIKAITSAMEDMADTGYITSETYAELAKLGGNFTDCLEWENGKLKLNVDKLKDLEIQQLATAKSANSLAISELELKAASLAAHGQDFSDIQAQIESLMKESAVYTQLQEEIRNAKPDDKKSSTKDEEPKSVTQFKKALAKKEHLLNTNQITEQEYYDWLDSESKRVFGNLKDYEEDLWKYEEQVYKWRQEQEQDLFDKKIENYKKLSDNALDKYVDGNGNELTVNASFDYARSQINSAITETQNRINELSLRKGFEDEIEELTSDLEGLYDTLDDINKQEIESQKEYIQTLKDEYSDLMDEQIDQQKKLSEEIEKSYENRISAIDKQIDALKKVSEAEERQKSILEAEKDVKEAMLELDKAKTKKRLVYSGDGSWQLKEDKPAVDEAKKNLEDKQQSLEEAKQDEQIAKLEEQKELLETQKDNSKEYYDKAVEDLESQKEAREKQYDILVDIYEQLGGDKKQTSLNESLVEKLTSNGDINKTVQGLTPTEMKQAITSGILTTDSNGNYTIDYSILQNNEQAVKDNTAELAKLNNQLSGKSDTVDSNTPTYNNKNLDVEGYLIGTDGKRILHDGKPIHAKNFSDEIAKRNTSKKMTDVVKGIGKFAGYDTMQDLINAMITGEYTIPKAQLSNFMGSTISPKISQNIPHMGEYMTNAVNNTAPPINFTVNVDGSADEKTIQAMETKIGNMLISYTDKLTSSIATSSLRRQNKS